MFKITTISDLHKNKNTKLHTVQAENETSAKQRLFDGLIYSHISLVSQKSILSRKGSAQAIGINAHTPRHAPLTSGGHFLVVKKSRIFAP